VSLPRYDDAGEPLLMRTARILLCACAAVAAAPLAIGGVVVTAVATTLAGAVPVAPATACGPSAPAGVAGTIDRWITRTVPGSPLAGTGAAMVAGAAGTGLDPRLLAAIALQETRLGTAGGGPAVFNPFGLGPGLAFSSWAGAIALAVRTLVTMHAGGAQTIAEISVHWAPIGAANDPGGLNASWSGGVGSAYAELGGDPAGPVFGSLSGPRGGAPAGCAAASHGRTA
jgi:hypothetical protein